MKTSLSKSCGKESLAVYFSQQIREGLEEARAGRLVDYEKVRPDWMKRLDRTSR